MELTSALLNALFCAGAVYGVIKTELHFLRRDIDAANARIDKLSQAPSCPIAAKT